MTACGPRLVTLKRWVYGELVRLRYALSIKHVQKALVGLSVEAYQTNTFFRVLEHGTIELVHFYLIV